MNLSLEQRAAAYHAAFPTWPPLSTTRRWIYGVWDIGNAYKSKQGYYGEYPHGYLARVGALFPEKKSGRTLHLFSGSVTAPGIKMDLRWIGQRPRGAVTGDAQRLSEYFEAGRFDMVYADPPYTVADAARYSTPMPNRRKVMAELARVVAAEGHVAWLDCVKPMYRKVEWTMIGEIGVARSTNHRVRMLFIFQRTDVNSESNDYIPDQRLPRLIEHAGTNRKQDQEHARDERAEAPEHAAQDRGPVARREGRTQQAPDCSCNQDEGTPRTASGRPRRDRGQAADRRVPRAGGRPGGWQGDAEAQADPAEVPSRTVDRVPAHGQLPGGEDRRGREDRDQRDVRPPRDGGSDREGRGRRAELQRVGDARGPGVEGTRRGPREGLDGLAGRPRQPLLSRGRS